MFKGALVGQASPNSKVPIENPSEVESSALLTGSAFIDHSSSGRLLMYGSDTLDLLNRLSTNKLEVLEQGDTITTVLTTPKGRVVDFLTVGARPGHLYCLTSKGRQQAVTDWIDFYTFGEDSSVYDVTRDTAQITVTGPEASETLKGLGCDVSNVKPFSLFESNLGGVPTLIWNTLSSGEESFELITEGNDVSRIRESLINAGCIPISENVWDSLRVTNGVPVYGAEYGEHTNPLESRLRGSISFDKGCYIGQEVIVRLDTYRKVQRQLMALVLSGPATPGDRLTLDERPVGVLTSVSPGLSGGYVGLGLVEVEKAISGNTLMLESGDVVTTLSDPHFATLTEISVF